MVKSGKCEEWDGGGRWGCEQPHAVEIQTWNPREAEELSSTTPREIVRVLFQFYSY